MKKAALFLDRDGVINTDHGYVYKPEDIEFVDGIFELVSHAKKANYLIIIVTNQAGIGRGLYTENDFFSLMDWMKTKFIDAGGGIDAIYFCPFHPEHGLGEYKKVSACRKPAPGMLIEAQNDFDIDFEHSIFIGDKRSDMQAGQSAGVATLLHLSDTVEARDIATPIQKLADAMPFIKS